MKKSITIYLTPENESEKDFDDLKNFYENHGFYHKGDSGIDIFFTTHYELKTNSISNRLSLGTKCQIIDNSSNTPLSYFLMPRSSISKTGMRMCNSIGLVDASYKNSLLVYVDYISDKQMNIAPGDRYFQLVIPDQMRCPHLYDIDIKVVRNFKSIKNTKSTRNGGFGSTNKYIIIK